MITKNMLHYRASNNDFFIHYKIHKSKEYTMAEEFSYEITEKYGVLSTSKSGWTMEFNAVSWNGRDPKFDIRSWSPDHEKMGKGITLTKEEVAALKELLAKV